MDQCYRRPATARPPRTSVDRVRFDQSRVKHLVRGRLALVHPPWFDDEVNELGASYFASQDVTVIMSASAPPCSRRTVGLAFSADGVG